VTEQHGAEHHVFRQLLGFGFHHQHGVLGAGDDQVELRGFELLGARIEDVLAIGVADAGGADRAVKRHASQAHGGGGADQGRDVAGNFRVERDYGGDHLNLVVDQSRGQGLVLGRTAFTLEEAAGNTAAGVEALHVVDGQREEVLAFLGVLLGNDRHQHHGFAHADHHGGSRLAGHVAGFEGDFVLAVLE